MRQPHIHASMMQGCFIPYREWDLNPHSHHWPKDFKSFVSTDSTIAARLIFQNRVQRYCFFFILPNIFIKK